MKAASKGLLVMVFWSVALLGGCKKWEHQQKHTLSLGPYDSFPEGADWTLLNGEEEFYAMPRVRECNRPPCRYYDIVVEGTVSGTLGFSQAYAHFEALRMDAPGYHSVEVPCYRTSGGTLREETRTEDNWQVHFRESAWSSYCDDLKWRPLDERLAQVRTRQIKSDQNPDLSVLQVSYPVASPATVQFRAATQAYRGEPAMTLRGDGSCPIRVNGMPVVTPSGKREDDGRIIETYQLMPAEWHTEVELLLQPENLEASLEGSEIRVEVRTRRNQHTMQHESSSTQTYLAAHEYWMPLLVSQPVRRFHVRDELRSYPLDESPGWSCEAEHPKVTRISSAHADGAYTTGDDVDLVVHFSEPVHVDTDDGVPMLTLLSGTADAAASYVSGSGSSELTFRYTVRESDGGPLDSGSLRSNDGRITDADGNPWVWHEPLPGEARLSKHAQLVLNAPEAPHVTDVSSDDGLEFQVAFSRPVAGDVSSVLELFTTGSVEGRLSPATPQAESMLEGTAFASKWSVRVEGLSGQGSYRLDVNASERVVDSHGRGLSQGFVSTTSYTVGRDSPADAGPEPVLDAGASETESGQGSSETETDPESSQTGTTSEDESTGVGSGSDSSQDTTPDTSASFDGGHGSSSWDAGVADAEVSNESDTEAPAVIEFVTVGEAPLGADSVAFDLLFSEPVTGVDANDFVLVTSGDGLAAAAVEVTGDGTAYRITLTGITGEGAIALNLQGDGAAVLDAAGNPFEGSHTSGFHLINQAPFVTSNTRIDPSPTTADSLYFEVTFSEPVTGVDGQNFSVTVTGSVNYMQLVVTGSDDHYVVVVDYVEGEGTARLDLNAVDTGIEDLAGAPLADGFSEGEVYTRELPEW